MFFGGFFRFVALLLLVGLLAAVGVNIYNAGVSAGIASEVGQAIAPGGTTIQFTLPLPTAGHDL